MAGSSKPVIDRDTEPIDQTVGRLSGRLEHMLDEMSQVSKLMLGNGQPGVLDRLARLEQKHEALLDVMERHCEDSSKREESLMRSIEDTNASVKSVSQSIQKHHDDKTQHSPIMFLSKRWYIFIVVAGFIVLHAISSMLEMTTVWKFLLALVGL